MVATFWIPLLAVVIVTIHEGTCIVCRSCDVTSSVSYMDANLQCNQAGDGQCSASTASACMLEGYLLSSRSFRIVKKCVDDCPLYINTTAEIVRCCTQDDCNEKFRPLPPSRGRGPALPPLRRYEDIEASDIVENDVIIEIPMPTTSDPPARETDNNELVTDDDADDEPRRPPLDRPFVADVSVQVNPTGGNPTTRVAANGTRTGPGRRGWLGKPRGQYVNKGQGQSKTLFAHERKKGEDKENGAGTLAATPALTAALVIAMLRQLTILLL